QKPTRPARTSCGTTLVMSDVNDMAERSTHRNLMRSESVTVPDPQPQTRNELQAWVREHLSLASPLETSLLAAIDAVFSRHERLWQESKHEAIQALSAGF